MRHRYTALALTVACAAVVLICWQHKTHAQSPVAIPPYTAHLTVTKDRVTSVGSRVRGVSIEVFARDRQGRTYQKSADGSVFVQDPVKRQILSWDSNSQEVLLAQWPYWSGRKGCWADAQGEHPTSFPGEDDWYKTPASPGETSETIDQHYKRRVVIENLGQKEIHGLTAYGMRTTMTPLPSAEPSDIPESTGELWKSSELGLKVLEVQTFSGSGWERKELSDLQRGDPDPALFQPPPGYKIQTIEYHQVPCER